MNAQKQKLLEKNEILENSVVDTFLYHEGLKLLPYCYEFRTITA